MIENSIQDVAGIPIEFLRGIDSLDYRGRSLPRYRSGTTLSSFVVRLGKCLAIRRFLKSSFRSLLFLEDDLAISEDFDKTVFQALSLDFDLFFLGGEHEIEPIPFGNWLKCKSVRNNHAVMFSRRGARKALSLLLKPTALWSDGDISRGLQTDILLGLCPSEMVAYQRETLSDNSGFLGDASVSDRGRVKLSGDALAVIDALTNCCSKVALFTNQDEILIMVSEKMIGFGYCIWIKCYEDSKYQYEIINSEFGKGLSLLSGNMENIVCFLGNNDGITCAILDIGQDFF